ncbi:MAG: response regulator transcription factor [Acidaminococcales bacterium]|jgi:DNA-binding NarL/FixJ family response regulator|nr:response regulator transcription factor [Acidaminococcales bacterium]
MSVRTLIVDDHILSRKGIASILREHAEFLIIGEAADGQEAVENAETLRPDLILMDIGMPVMSGLDATKRIKAKLPQVRIVILSVSDDAQDFFEAIKNGAQGYLLKNMDTGGWIEYLLSIAAGDAPVSRALADRILKEFNSAEKKPQKEYHTLTGRERDVLLSACEGLSNKEIANKLCISESTVKNHLRGIMEKLHLRNRMQLVGFAYKNNILK